MSKISSVRIEFIIAALGRSLTKFDKSQFRDVCIYSYMYVLKFLTLFVFEIEAVKKCYGWAGLGRAWPGRFG